MCRWITHRWIDGEVARGETGLVMDDLIEVVSGLQHEEVSNASEMLHSFVICRDSHICIALPFPASNSRPQPKLLFSICTSAVPTKDR